MLICIYWTPSMVLGSLSNSLHVEFFADQRHTQEKLAFTLASIWDTMMQCILITTRALAYKQTAPEQQWSDIQHVRQACHKRYDFLYTKWLVLMPCHRQLFEEIIIIYKGERGVIPSHLLQPLPTHFLSIKRDTRNVITRRSLLIILVCVTCVCGITYNHHLLSPFDTAPSSQERDNINASVLCISVAHVLESFQWVDATTLTRPSVVVLYQQLCWQPDQRLGCICPLVLDATSIATRWGLNSVSSLPKIRRGRIKHTCLATV